MARWASVSFAHQDNTQALHQARVICAQSAISKASLLGLTKTRQNAASAPSANTRRRKARHTAKIKSHVHLAATIVAKAKAHCQIDASLALLNITTPLLTC